MTDQLAMSELYEKAGSASELARRLGISPSAVLQWDKVPANRVLAVEKITGILRHLQRPDIFGDAPVVPEAAE
jgi:DNA-binding transcriptional regulator YdaS (Cro superfamily)